jgi:hypothetical protein
MAELRERSVATSCTTRNRASCQFPASQCRPPSGAGRVGYLRRADRPRGWRHHRGRRAGKPVPGRVLVDDRLGRARLGQCESPRAGGTSPIPRGVARGVVVHPDVEGALQLLEVAQLTVLTTRPASSRAGDRTALIGPRGPVIGARDLADAHLGLIRGVGKRNH